MIISNNKNAKTASSSMLIRETEKITKKDVIIIENAPALRNTAIILSFVSVFNYFNPKSALRFSVCVFVRLFLFFLCFFFGFFVFEIITLGFAGSETSPDKNSGLPPIFLKCGFDLSQTFFAFFLTFFRKFSFLSFNIFNHRKLLLLH